jgi:hypothetical protein
VDRTDSQGHDGKEMATQTGDSKIQQFLLRKSCRITSDLKEQQQQQQQHQRKLITLKVIGNRTHVHVIVLRYWRTYIVSDGTQHLGFWSSQFHSLKSLECSLYKLLQLTTIINI